MQPAPYILLRMHFSLEKNGRKPINYFVSPRFSVGQKLIAPTCLVCFLHLVTQRSAEEPTMKRS
jgi:hypothetical protein